MAYGNLMLAHTIHATLTPYATTTPISIAVSGGMDSISLLHVVASAALPNPLRVLHVNHGLSAYAAPWAHFVEKEAAELHIPCEILCIQETPPPGDSIEAWARRVRYQALAHKLQQGELLLTAHTADDQAETVLLQLLRGAGLPGLAAMPTQRALGQGILLRPWLTLSRDTIETYAHHQGFPWIEDDSNDNTRFDRNYLRHRVFPLLKSRWPACLETLSRSARFCAEAQHEISQHYDETVKHAMSTGKWGEACFALHTIAALEASKQRTILRHWLTILKAPQPNESQWQNLHRTVLHASPNATPAMQWSKWEIRRYRDTLYCAPMAQWHQLTPGLPIAWDLHAPLQWGPYRLTATQSTQQPVWVRSATAKDRFLLPNDTHHRTWKYLCQHWGIPPWERACTPIICTVDNRLLAIVGYGQSTSLVRFARLSYRAVYKNGGADAVGNLPD